MDITDIHLPYALPTALLLAGLVAKLPTFLRSWRDSEARATWIVLLWASAVFLSVAPASIHKINTVTGVPNIAAPWTYSLLTGFCGACLVMIISWREQPSPQRRRRIRWVWAIHALAVTALWLTFLLADVPEERIYDLDTYYANTPFMREHIVLYLLTYLVSTLVSAWMIWTWVSEVNSRWLKAGLAFLQVGYLFGILFDVAKLVAVGARWAGKNWDWLSVKVAPPFAILGATLVATGFIVPVAGPALQKWTRDRREYWQLRPLWRAVRDVTPAAAQARLGLWVPLDLRLVQRQQCIHDALRVLAPHLDRDLYQKVQHAASAHTPEKARGVAGAVIIRAAINAHRSQISFPASSTADQLGTDIPEHIDAISRALHHPRLVDSIHLRVTNTEGVDAHAL
ncbi:MAB_1171c family putative transporter [Streptomyces sp. NPDC050211]|uniref:MAB_1171c family putative transporter n=1 Tax=Streptomyces sp. NPDC050211 TaxID=3154932 RepID=UPI00342EE326